MKLDWKYILIFGCVAFFLISVGIQTYKLWEDGTLMAFHGCDIPYSDWEKRALWYFDNMPNDMKCEERCNILSSEMVIAMYDHDIVYGQYEGTPHVWIEVLDGTIIDPTQGPRMPKNNYTNEHNRVEYRF